MITDLQAAALVAITLTAYASAVYWRMSANATRTSHGLILLLVSLIGFAFCLYWTANYL